MAAGFRLASDRFIRDCLRPSSPSNLTSSSSSLRRPGICPTCSTSGVVGGGDNKHKPRQQWIIQAAGQATADLTHAQWWHRLLAARRLERLTGRRVVTPDLFEPAAWQALQTQWRDWLRNNQALGPRRWLIDQGISAGPALGNGASSGGRRCGVSRSPHPSGRPGTPSRWPPPHSSSFRAGPIAMP